MDSSLYLLIFATLFTTVLGQNQTINPNHVTNGTQDYFRIAQAELLIKVKLSEMENDAIDVRFLDRLTVIEMQQQQVLNETQQVNQTLIPLQALSLARKYCIQTYDSQFITHSSAKEKLNLCIKRAQGYSSITYRARSQTTAAKNYATNTLPRNLQSCATYNYNQTELDQCYIKYVELAVKRVQNMLEDAKVYREESIFEMNSLTQTAVKCSYNVEKVVLESVNLTLKKINLCIDDFQRKIFLDNRNTLN